MRFSLKGRKIQKKKELEIQEVLLDKIVKDKENLSLVFEKKIESPLQKRRIYFLFGIFFSLLMLLFVRTFFFQIIQYKSFLSLAEKNKVGIYLIRPFRGIIYDKDFNQLVTNKTVFDLICEKNLLPYSLEKRKKQILELSKSISEDFDKIYQIIENSQEEKILISENLPHQKLVAIISEIDKFPGFRIEETIVRNYISPQQFSHLIGYTGKINREELRLSKDYGVCDIIGKTGLEKFYEGVLRGKVGKLRIERDAFGKERKKEKISEPQSGQNIVLWLDSELQEKIIELLEKNLKAFKTEKAAVVVMDPNTGGILSLASFPTFNNNLFSQKANSKEVENLFEHSNSPLLNRAISGLYPSGSVIKPFIGLAALEEKIISPKTKINCQGLVKIPNPWGGEPSIFRDWKIHGIVDIKKAIAESCNVFFYTIGGGYKNFKGLGVEKIKEYLKLFGFERRLNIDLPNEKSGFIPDLEWKKKNLKDDWRIGDTYNLSIGQGFIKVTPLQMAAATVAIANEGNLLKPRVVREIVDSEKNIIQEIRPEIIRELPFEKEYFKLIKQGMREAVTSGTAHLLNSLPIKVAAKTGTAQTGKQGIYHYWLTLFAPYENPEIVLTVLVESSIEKDLTPANFIAKQILEWYFTQK